jgi:ABC-2 type transport system permease protein
MSTWFSIRRAAALFRVEARQLLFDHSALMLIFGLPVLQILMYGYGVSFVPRQVPIAISTNDTAVALGAPMGLAGQDMMRLAGPVGALGEAERAVRRGEALVGMDVAKASADSPMQVRFFADGSDPATIRPVLVSLNAYIWRKAAQYYGDEQAPTVSTEWIFGAPEREAWAISPGLVGVVVMVSMLFLGAMSLVRERERGTWESLLATPIRAAEALVGKLAPYLVIGVIETALLLVLVHWLFGVPLPAASLALIAASPLFAGSYLLLGFIFSALAQTQLQAVQGAVGVYLPSLLLSGFLFPFSGMPQWAKWVGEALPLTHYLRASREILLRQAPPQSVLSHLVPIAAFTAVTVVVAVLAFRRRFD